MNLRETLLASGNRRYIEVEVEGTCYKLQSLTQAEKTKVGLIALDSKGNPILSKMDEMRARTLAYVLVDENRQRLFADNEWELLTELRPEVFDSLYDAAESMSLTEKDKQVAEQLKNSESATA